MKPIWGIDLGGTKIEAVVLDTDNNYEVLSRKRIDTEATQGYEHIVSRILHLLTLVEQETGLKPQKVGMGTPGAIDPDLGTIKNSNSTALIGKPLRHDLERQKGIPFFLANDANCFALAEAKMGTVPERIAHAEVVFGVIMGTGVGGGIVVNGKVINGRHSIGGEWGHNFLDASGGDCYCGRIGCVERLLSGPASERYYQNKSGTFRKLRDIYTRSQEGSDILATETIDRLIHFFGKALGPIINILDPEAIVLGGGVGNIDRLYTDGVKEVEKYVFNPRMETLFLKPKLGDSAGVFGAAMLVE
ncbi:MAG: ROK family protein [Bacteroidia bacterium]|nr:ROK family protein [Bacteroidia bacterium]